MDMTRQTVDTTRMGSTTRGLLTTKEACRILHMHASTLRRWSEKGVITPYRIGPGCHPRYRREDVAALLMRYTQDARRAAVKPSRQ